MRSSSFNQPEARPHGTGTSLTLLERIRAHDQAAWAQVVELYRPLVTHWCSRSGVVRDDADDVAQDVFRAAAEKLPTFRRDRPGDTFRGWLRGITRLELLQYFRRTGRQMPGTGGTENLRLLEQTPDPLAAESGSDSDSPEELDRLHRRAIELVRCDFEDSTWRAFERTALDGRAAVAVAEEMEMTPAAVRKAKSRVLRRLKELIGDLIE